MKATNLQSIINQSIGLIKSKTLMPVYSDIKIVVNINTDISDQKNYKPILQKNNMKNIKDFSKDYEKILGMGYSWVSLQLAGIFDKNLIFIIEFPKNYTKEKANTHSPVSLSWPPFKNAETYELDWDITKYYTIV